MKIKYVRTTFLVWGIICLLVPGYTMLQFPIMKITTPAAMVSIEDQFIDKSSMEKEEDKKSYDLLKNSILFNDKLLKKSASIRQYGVMLLGFVTAVLCFLSAAYNTSPHVNVETGSVCSSRKK